MVYFVPIGFALRSRHLLYFSHEILIIVCTYHSIPIVPKNHNSRALLKLYLQLTKAFECHSPPGPMVCTESPVCQYHFHHIPFLNTTDTLVRNKVLCAPCAPSQFRLPKRGFLITVCEFQITRTHNFTTLLTFLYESLSHTKRRMQCRLVIRFI